MGLPVSIFPGQPGVPRPFRKCRPIEQEMFSGMSKTAFIPSVPATSEDDFEVSAASKLAGYRRFFGVLKVVRTTDGRVLFPFDGAPELGPYATKLEAVAAAQVYGEHIVTSDLARPEL
ncbi:hypothetical protein BX589_121148 [Paraburkholderia fungorum]|nr:hypothetical protein BX589_121148 [Paraburkholderia fungorum]